MIGIFIVRRIFKISLTFWKYKFLFLLNLTNQLWIFLINLILYSILLYLSFCFFNCAHKLIILSANLWSKWDPLVSFFISCYNIVLIKKINTHHILELAHSLLFLGLLSALILWYIFFLLLCSISLIILILPIAHQISEFG